MKRQRLKQRLYWDVKQQALSPRIYTRKKSRVSPLLYKIFYREFKQILIRHLMGHSKNFSRYTNFYRVNAELPRLLSPQMQLPINNVEPESRKMSLFLIRNYNVQDRFNKISFVKQYIIQRRWYKERMVRWQKYSQKGLIFALFQHKNIRFFFTPLRVKKILETKKHKQIRLYNHILNIHPRLGQTTVGLVGNKTARNFIFIKIRILLKSL